MTETRSHRPGERALRRGTVRRRSGYVEHSTNGHTLSRRPVHTAAVVLAALACGLGAAACGGGQSAEEREAAEAATARWQEGVPRWRADMLRTLDQISLMLGDAQTVDRLHDGNAQALARLARLEERLEGCSAEIRSLGAAPDGLEPVREEALQTCRSLAQGAGLVRDGVAAWQSGNRDTAINRATTALSNGQRGLDRVSRRLSTALSGD